MYMYPEYEKKYIIIINDKRALGAPHQYNFGVKSWSLHNSVRYSGYLSPAT